MSATKTQALCVKPTSPSQHPSSRAKARTPSAPSFPVCSTSCAVISLILGIFVPHAVLSQQGAEKRQLLPADKPGSIPAVQSICCAASACSSPSAPFAFQSITFPHPCPAQLLQCSSHRREKKRQIHFSLPISLLLFFIPNWPIAHSTLLMPGCQMEQFSPKRNAHQSCKEYSINL